MLSSIKGRKLMHLLPSGGGDRLAKVRRAAGFAEVRITLATELHTRARRGAALAVARTPHRTVRAVDATLAVPVTPKRNQCT